jgi:Ca-activated chloride channel family protein
MKRLSLFIAMGFIVFAAAALTNPGPASGESRVRVHSEVDKPVVLAGCGDRVVIKVGLRGLTVPVMPQRVPFNLAIVLDRSGSMGSYGKMENARLGAMEIVERLGPDDILSVIVYSDRPQVLVPAQPVRDKDALMEIISGVYSGGSTALYGGVAYGADQVRRNMSWEYINRIILLSDGLANVGPSSTGALANLGSDLEREGITVTTIGVGLDYNEDLMTALAARSGGNAYFASTSRELPAIFAEEIGEAMTLMARDLKIRIDCPRGVKPVGVIGREGQISGQTMAVKVDKLYGVNEKYALFEVEVPGRDGGERFEIADVNVEYTDPYTNEAVSERQKVSIAYDGDRKMVEEKENAEVVKQAVLTRASDAKREAVALADKGDHAGAAAVMKKNALELEKAAGRCDNDDELLEEARECKDISVDIEANEGLTKYQRKRVVNEAFTQSTQQGYVSEEDKDADGDSK